MLPRTVWLLAAMLWLAAPVVAQSVDGVSVGDRVRLHAPTTGIHVGQVLDLSPESLTIATEGSWRSFPVSELSRLEVSVRQGSRAGQGALIGLGIAAAGWVLASRDSRGDLSPGQGAALMFGLVGVPLTGLGALIGSRIRTDVWRDATVDGGHGEAATAPPPDL